MNKIVCCLFLLSAAWLHAEPRAFTDQFGRSIVAELLSVDGDQARIRRDDGQIFNLAVSTLTDEDKKFIKDWAGKQSSGSEKVVEKATIDPKKLIVGTSRGKFASRTLAKFEGYTHKHEDWGYSIQLQNQNLGPIENIRVEYNLFARTYSDISSPTMISGSKDFKTIASRGSEVFRTGSTEVCKRRDVYFGNSGGEMRGIWLRVYVNGEMMIEQASPESLMTTEKWGKVTN